MRQAENIQPIEGMIAARYPCSMMHTKRSSNWVWLRVRPPTRRSRGHIDRQVGIVTLSSGSPIHEMEFDLVIVADAIRSATRKLVLDNMEADIIDTG